MPCGMFGCTPDLSSLEASRILPPVPDTLKCHLGGKTSPIQNNCFRWYIFAKQEGQFEIHTGKHFRKFLTENSVHAFHFLRRKAQRSDLCEVTQWIRGSDPLSFWSTGFSKSSLCVSFVFLPECQTGGTQSTLSSRLLNFKPGIILSKPSDSSLLVTLGPSRQWQASWVMTDCALLKGNLAFLIYSPSAHGTWEVPKSSCVSEFGGLPVLFFCSSLVFYLHRAMIQWVRVHFLSVLTH